MELVSVCIFDLILKVDLFVRIFNHCLVFTSKFTFVSTYCPYTLQSSANNGTFCVYVCILVLVGDPLQGMVG